MESIDASKLRDPAFRARYQAKLDELEAVRARHTFIDYTTRETLFDELEAIYRENLVEYDTHYRRNAEALAEQEAARAAARDQMLPYRAAEADELVAAAQAWLAAESYAENARARPIVERLEGLIAGAVRERTHYEAALRHWENRLAEVAPLLWAEPHATLMARLVAARRPLTDPSVAPPAEPPGLAEEEIAAFCNRKATDLKAFGRPRGRWRTRVEKLRQPGVSRETFLSEQMAWRHSRRRRWVMVGAAAGLAGLLLAVALWWGPGWYAQRQEAAAWQTAQAAGTVGAYQAYLEAYPTGSHAEAALAAQMRIPTGTLTGYVDPLQRVLDYTGALRNLQPHGQGEGRYQAGGGYTGYWRSGLPDSLGTYTAADGTRYIGEWHVGRREGQGIRYFATGGQYEGQWREDQYHGQGSLLLPDSTSYVGGWRQGQRHGQGRYRRANGTTYQGGWQADLYHGRGIYRDSTGIIYDGQWIAGRRHGQGMQTWPDGRTFQGEWVADQRQGDGTLAWPDGSVLVAPWRRDSIDGWGKFTTRYRDEYTGTWRGSLDQVTLFDGQGNVFKTGRIENGLFLDQATPPSREGN